MIVYLVTIPNQKSVYAKTQPVQESPATYRLVQPKGTISPGRYIGGAVLGGIVGFGLGHSVSGIWKRYGWLFTVADLAIAVPFIHGITATDDTPWVGSPSYNRWITFSKYAFLPVKILQVADLLLRPTVSLKKPQQTSPPPRASLSPWIAPGVTGVAASLRF